MTSHGFFLGGIIDAATGERTGEQMLLDPDHLTTHGVIVGMTGSGKTGLGVALIEEAMLQGIPCLVIDPKGDMGNLALNFPGLEASDFRPWIDEASATRGGGNADDVAADTAASWSKGLGGWDLGPEQMRQLASASAVTIYTPGSTSGVSLDIVGSLAAPVIGWDGNEEILRDEIEGFVSSLLGLAGVRADPVAGTEHILLASIIEEAWSRGRDLDLAGLIGAVVDPPFRKLGVFDVDAFFPRKDRTALAMRLNGLVASPAFASWMQGEPLDVSRLLYDGDRPRTAVVYLSHLSDQERQFVVTLVLSKVVTWMRRQQGTGTLRALIYMDEVFGFAPPTAEPPSKKPILTILKQARAFGVGMVLSTQNPMDLDYKAMSNAGTWMIGRLQTARDKARILDGIASASGGVDVATLDGLVTGLGARSFVHHSTRASAPRLFTTRWVMSYLAGPLTRDQVKRLTDETGRPEPREEKAGSARSVSADATEIARPVAAGVEVVWTAPSAPWLEEVGGVRGSRRVAPAAVADVRLRYSDRQAGIDHLEEFEAVLYPLDDRASDMTAVDHDDRDFLPTPSGVAEYVLGGAAIDEPGFWKALTAALTDRLSREQAVTVLKNSSLGIYSRIGESPEAFEQRCVAAADDRADQDVAALRDRYKTRIRSAQDAIRRADHRVRELEADVGARRQTELMTGAGDLLGAIIGGRRSAAGLRQAATRRNQTRRVEERRDTAVDRLRMQEETLAELESDLARDVEAITDRWNASVGDIEELAVPLGRSDIEVKPLRMLWLPVGPSD